MSEGLRKRRRPYTNIPSAAIEDDRLSFKALGVLIYLLGKPPGWKVRSAVIAVSRKDGKEAIQAALRELGTAGYYRIERRRLTNGQLVTGTAISEDPDPAWAAEYDEYSGPVPVFQQADGTFRVRRKDGALVPDGFGAPENLLRRNLQMSRIMLFAQVRPEPGFPAPVNPVPVPEPGNPAPVLPEPVNPAPLLLQISHYRKIFRILRIRRARLARQIRRSKPVRQKLRGQASRPLPRFWSLNGLTTATSDRQDA